MLEVSKGSYKGASRQTVRALVSVLSDLGRKEARLFVRRCLQGGTRLTLSGDLWSADGIGLFAIFGHYINEDFQLCSGLLGLVSCVQSVKREIMSRTKPRRSFSIWVSQRSVMTIVCRNDLGQVQEEMYDHKLGML